MGILSSQVLDAYGFDHSMLFPGMDLSSYIQQIHDIAWLECNDKAEMIDTQNPYKKLQFTTN